MKFAIIDSRTGKILIKSSSEEIVREGYKAYSQGWGKLSGYVVGSVK